MRDSMVSQSHEGIISPVARSGLSPFPHRDTGLTRHPGLAEAATIFIEMKAIPAIVRRHFKEMIPAFVFVMAGFRNRPGWTTLQAFPAGVLGKMQTIFMVIGICPNRRRNSDPGHYRTDADCLAPWSDEPITEPKSSQAGNMRGMAHGPAGGQAITWRYFSRPERRIHRRYRRKSGILQGGRDVLAQFSIEHLSEMPRPDPALRRVGGLLPIIRFGGHGLGQNPADHRKVFGASLGLRKGLLEDLHGGEVKGADILF
jgi:hypothetical protein